MILNANVQEDTENKSIAEVLMNCSVPPRIKNWKETLDQGLWSYGGNLFHNLTKLHVGIRSFDLST